MSQKAPTTPRADLEAMETFLSVLPAWSGIKTASEALGLKSKVLLHSGPPANPAHNLVATTLNSAAVAAVFEGWARDLQEGLALVRSGEVRFEPAQDHRVATPMAAVVSPAMRLIEMTDLSRPERKAYAPINGGGTGGDPAPRYGRCTPQALELLRFLNGAVADRLALSRADQAPHPWLPVMDQALTNGDDGHLCHPVAHGALLQILRGRGREIGTPAFEFIAKWPLFHLNFFMAMARCTLDAAQGVCGSSVITSFGGNGEHFGLKMSGWPNTWITVPATPPRGKVRPPFRSEQTLGAYGDSALAEAYGLGALAHSYCPTMRELHREFYPEDLLDLPRTLNLSFHPEFPVSQARVGLSVQRIVSTGRAPVVELGIVERTGQHGGLGAGLYQPPLSLFEDAWKIAEQAKNPERTVRGSQEPMK